VKTRKIVSRLVAGVQCALGGVASTLAYFIYSSAWIREAISISDGEVYLFMFLFLAFGAFSIFSGLLLTSERFEG
jgi:hypothetical protein